MPIMVENCLKPLNYDRNLDVLKMNFGYHNTRHYTSVAKICKDVAKIFQRRSKDWKKDTQNGAKIWSSGLAVYNTIYPVWICHLCIFARPKSAPYAALFGQSLRIFAKICKDGPIFATVKIAFSYKINYKFLEFYGGPGF